MSTKTTVILVLGSIRDHIARPIAWNGWGQSLGSVAAGVRSGWPSPLTHIVTNIMKSRQSLKAIRFEDELKTRLKAEVKRGSGQG